ncbi:MAG: hypothetical protein H6816_06920 [Phycisphaerales bacterium]|nr:hypothetical protein [Phycisphaerales bacterium]
MDEPVLVQYACVAASARLAVQVAGIGGELFVSMNSQQRDVFFDLARACRVTLRLPHAARRERLITMQVRLWGAAECNS